MTRQNRTGSEGRPSEPARRAKRPKDRMVNFHLNDGVAGKSRDEQEDQVRAMPMTTGIIDAAWIYQLFEKNGYKGPVMCEPMVPSTDRFAVQDVEKSMAEVKDAFNRC